MSEGMSVMVEQLILKRDRGEYNVGGFEVSHMPMQRIGVEARRSVCMPGTHKKVHDLDASDLTRPTLSDEVRQQACRDTGVQVPSEEEVGERDERAA